MHEVPLQGAGQTAPAPAGLRTRLAAFLWDYVLIAAFLLAVFLLVTLVPGLERAAGMVFTTPGAGPIAGFLTITLPVATYFALSESSGRMASWGKERLGLRVVWLSGERLTIAQGYGRNLLKFLPWELSHVSLRQIEGWPLAPQDPGPLTIAGFAVVWMLVIGNVVSLMTTRRRQALYDLVLGTVVLRER